MEGEQPTSRETRKVRRKGSNFQTQDVLTTEGEQLFNKLSKCSLPIHQATSTLVYKCTRAVQSNSSG